MPQDYAGAQWMPSTRFWRGHNGAAPRYIIVHGTASDGTAASTANWLNTQTEVDATSVHYVVDRAGAVAQLVSEEDSAWGNGVLSQGHEAFWSQVSPQGNPNWVTFSIEHVKPHSDNSDSLTPAQQSASFALIKSICRRHNIPAHMADATGGITGHYSIDPVNRSRCPGPYPFAALFAYLADNASVPVDDMSFPNGVPAGWHDDGKTLTAPNGVPVVMGFRNQVLTNGWNPQNLPLAPEAGANPCDPSDPHSGDGSQQFFTSEVLVWVKSDGSFRRVPGGVAARAIAMRPVPAAALSPDTAKKQKLQAQVKAVEAELEADATAAN